MADASTEVLYNPFDPGYIVDPYSQYRRLRDNDPVHQTAFGPFVLSKYDDVLRFLRDPQLSVDDANAGPSPLRDLMAAEFPDANRGGGQTMLDRDPPDHDRLRQLVSKAFTPKRIEELRGRVQQYVDEALGRAGEHGAMDLISDLAFPLPFAVISDMLGMPDHLGDPLQLREWSGTIVRSLEPPSDFDLLRRIAEASQLMEGYLRSVLEWKRENMADDLLSALLTAEEEGDKLNDEELVAQVALLFIAGHETTVNLIGNGVYALVRNREELERVRTADATGMAVAIEELLRYDPPVQMTRRITLEDVDVRGTNIPKGTFVMCSLGSANRDADHFGPTSEKLDIGRADAREHLSFGGGAHYCLGAALARLEGAVAIGTLVQRFPNIELAGDVEYNGRLNLRGLDRLPVTLS